MNCLIFDEGEFRFGIAIDNIERIVDVEGKIYPLPLLPNYVSGFMNFQGRVITIIDLNTFFQIENNVSGGFLLISNKMKHIGYLVKKIEGFVDIEDVKIKDAEMFNIDNGRKEYIRYVAEDPTGRIVSILDIDKIEVFLKNPKNWSYYYEA